MIDIAVIILLALSAIFCILGVIGLFRFKDAYTRVHAAGLVSGLGFIFVVAAAIVYAASEISVGNTAYVSFIFHVAFAFIVVLITAIVSTHVIMRSAYHSGNVPKVKVDALKEEKK